jgi:hypothetical protein
MCYGYKSSPEHPAITIISNDLTTNGYATFVFRFTSEAFAMDIRGQVQDIEAIVEYFADQFDSIVLLASSLGALSASIVAARSTKVDFLITLNGFFGLRALSPRFYVEFMTFRAAGLFLPKHRTIWQYYKQQFLPKQIKAQTLVLHSPRDNKVLIEQSHYFFNHLTAEKEFQEITLLDHNISNTSDAHAIADKVAVWLDRHVPSKH